MSFRLESGTVEEAQLAQARRELGSAMQILMKQMEILESTPLRVRDLFGKLVDGSSSKGSRNKNA